MTSFRYLRRHTGTGEVSVFTVPAASPARFQELLNTWNRLMRASTHGATWEFSAA